MLFCSVQSREERTWWLWSQAPALAAPVSVTRASRQVSKTLLERHGAASVTGKMTHCAQRAPEPIAWAVRRLRPLLPVESFSLICLYGPGNWVGLLLVSVSSDPNELQLLVFSAFQEPKVVGYYSASKPQFQETIKKIVWEWFICIQMAAHEGEGQYVVHELSTNSVT